MDTSKPTILVTGVSGNLGQRLVPMLSDYKVVGVDLTPPTHSPVDSFVPLDLGAEETTRELLLLMREVQPVSVVHLAFVIDPQRSGARFGSLFFLAASQHTAPICPRRLRKTRR